MAPSAVFCELDGALVDGVTAIPHNKGCGCSDGSNIEVMLRTLAAYAELPNVAGVVFIGLGCEKTNLTVMEKYLNDQHRPLNKPVARIGIQDAGHLFRWMCDVQRTWVWGIECKGLGGR